MTISMSDRVRVADDVLISNLQEESVILNLDSERYYGLDDVGTRFLSVLNTSDSIEAVTTKRELAADVGLYVPGAARTGATTGYSVAAGKDVRRDPAAQTYWIRSRDVAGSRS